MILKIERHNENQEYWLFDSIEKISISETHMIGDPDGGWTHYDVMIYDHLTSNKDGDKYKPTPYRLLICRLDYGKEISIGFDTVCYIMNNTGQTVDKIVVNYRNK